ncbi:MAG TPA: hypothetical protein VJL29_10890, partial [Thermoguttaceae bacterium]|nr:hypothetical protein [Thermoguttaceae bacterium]
MASLLLAAISLSTATAWAADETPIHAMPPSVAPDVGTTLWEPGRAYEPIPLDDTNVFNPSDLDAGPFYPTADPRAF